MSTKGKTAPGAVTISTPGGRFGTAGRRDRKWSA